VLNYGDHQALRREYQQYQKQAQIFQPAFSLTSKMSNKEITKEIEEIVLELKKTEKQLQAYYENSEPNLAEIIKKFIENNKKFTRNKEDKEIRKKTREYYKELKNKNLSEKIEHIIEDCEKMVGLELLLEKKQNEIQNLKKEETANQTHQAQVQQINLPFKP